MTNCDQTIAASKYENAMANSNTQMTLALWEETTIYLQDFMCAV